jgi:hypothetical protein
VYLAPSSSSLTHTLSLLPFLKKIEDKSIYSLLSSLKNIEGKVVYSLSLSYFPPFPPLSGPLSLSFSLPLKRKYTVE